MTPTAAWVQGPGLLRWGIPGRFGLECEHSLQPQSGTTRNRYGCSLWLQWRVGQAGSQVWAKPHGPLIRM